MMRTLTLLPVAIALTHATAFAAPQEGPAGTPPMTAVQVSPLYGETFKTTPAEIAEVKGVYAMDNGEMLRVFVERHQLHAQIGGRLQTELTQVAANRFVSADQRITLDFIPIAFGDQIVLTYPLNADLASSPMVTVRLAAN